MKSLTFLTFAFFALFHRVSCTVLEIENAVRTNIVYNAEIPVRYLSVHFKEHLYIFSVDYFVNEGASIVVSRSGDNGKTWLDDNDAIMSPDDHRCETYSAYVINNKLVLFFYSLHNYMVTSEDGLRWTKPEKISLPHFYGETLYISGTPADVFGDGKRYVYICSKKLPELPYDTKIKAKCILSDDEGKKWNRTKYIYIEGNGRDIYAEKAFFYQNSLYLVAVVDEKKELFFCSELNKTDVHCTPVKLEQMNSYTIEEVGVISNNLSFIVKNEESEVFFATAYDGINVMIQEKELPAGYGFTIVETKDYTSSVFIWQQWDVDVTIIKGFVARKAGCEIPNSENENRVYENAFLPDNTKEDSYSCKMSYLSSETSDDGLYKLFRVRVGKETQFSSNCFTYSFYTDREEKQKLDTMQANTLGTLKKNTRIIQMRNVENVDNLDNMKDIIFYFPVHFGNIFFNGMRTKCSSTDKKFHIYFKFDNLRHTLKVTSTVKRVNHTSIIHTDVKTVNKVKHEVTTNFTDSHNIPTLSDYSVHDNMVVNFSECPKPITTQNYYLPKGTYVIKENKCSVGYLITNFIPQQFSINYIQSAFGLVNTMSIQTTVGGEKYKYEGVDFTNTSPNYVPLKEEFKNAKKINVVVANFSSERTIGLICPVVDTTEHLDCFDEVFNENEKLVKIHSLFKKRKVFVIPKRKILNRDGDGVETLLYMDNLLIKEMRQDMSVVSFTCKCKIQQDVIHIRYIISPYYERSYIINKFVNGKTVLQAEHMYESIPSETKTLPMISNKAVEHSLKPLPLEPVASEPKPLLRRFSDKNENVYAVYTEVSDDLIHVKDDAISKNIHLDKQTIIKTAVVSPKTEEEAGEETRE